LRSNVNVVFAEVNAGFEEGDEFDERLLYWCDAAAECAAHLAGGLAGLGEGLGFDEVADGLGLSEVEFAGEECALGKFAGVGEAGSEEEGAAEEKVEDDGGAVGGDLDEVVAGVGVGGGEEGDDGFVDGLGGLRVSGLVEDGGEAGTAVFERLTETDELGGDGGRVGATEADDSDAAAAGGRRDGGDGVDDVGRDFRNLRLVFAHAGSIVGKGARRWERVRSGGRGGGG